MSKQSNNFHIDLKNPLVNRVLVILAGLVLLLVINLIFSPNNDHVTQKTSKNNNGSNAETTAKQPANQDQVAGNVAWQADYLPDEKLSFKYPTTWSNTPGTASSSSDQVTLTSPSNLLLTITTGVTQSFSGFGTVLGSQPITTMGSNYFLDFYNQHAQTGGLAQGACIATTPANSADYPPSKNIVSAATGGNTPYNEVCLSFPDDDSGTVFESPVSMFANNQDFSDALKIIESITY